MTFILSAKQLIFLIQEIRDILPEADKDHTTRPYLRGLVEHRLTETEKKFQASLLLREKLKNVIRDWQNKPDKAPTVHKVSHLIQGD